MKIPMNWSRQQLSLFATLLIAVLLFVGASIRYTGFATPAVFINLLDDNAFLGVAAIGMTFVILSGGIDLSVGAVIGLASILTAFLIERLQIPSWLVVPAVLLLGSGFGALMGFIIATFELAPFLVTLAGMFFARGLAYTISLDSIAINDPFFIFVSQSRLNLGFASIPSLALGFLIIVALSTFISTQTRFGRSVYALGGNRLSTRLMGLKVIKCEVSVYALSGFMAALAGLFYTFYTRSGNATAAMGLELDAIAAVVIGGTLLTGGSGSMIGTLIGTLILGMIQTIITFESTLSSWWTKIIIGALLFFFVILQKIVTRISHTTMKAGILGFFFIGMIFSTESAKARAWLDKSPQLDCPAGQSSGALVVNGFYQLTGTHLRVGQTEHLVPELPDPSPPYVTADGSVEIYGSAQHFIRYKSWDEYSKGGCYETILLDIVGANRYPYSAVYTHSWDLRKFRIESATRKPMEVFIGGAMSPSEGRPQPLWPEDNINRRIYFFRLNDLQQWMRDLVSIVGDISVGWLGHSYGGNLIQEDSAPNIIKDDQFNPIAFFYEKVSDDRRNGPYKTEMFAVRMSQFDQVIPNSEVKIFDLGDKPYPSTERLGNSRSVIEEDPKVERIPNGYLVEGPRPLQIDLNGKRIFIIGFSSGDFPTDKYHINVMWSSDLMGPYHPILNSKKSDLFDFGAQLKNKFGLSWVGRPSFYQTPDGSYEMLFHAVIKNILPENDYSRWPTRFQLWEFYRCIFKVKIQIFEGFYGEPVIEVLPLS